MIKLVTVFLIVMMVLAMFGRLRVPKIGRKRATKCENCGRHRIGSGACECGEKGS